MCYGIQQGNLTAKVNETQVRDWAEASKFGSMKVIQVDAGCFVDGFTYFGCVFKDKDSKVEFAACHKEFISVKLALVEILALRWCLQLALDLRLDRIVVQSDTLSVVDWVNFVHPQVVLELVAQDVRLLLRSFCEASVMFVSRKCNLNAHNFVGLGKQLGFRSWLGNPPICTSMHVSVFS